MPLRISSKQVRHTSVKVLETRRDMLMQECAAIPARTSINPIAGMRTRCLAMGDTIALKGTPLRIFDMTGLEIIFWDYYFIWYKYNVYTNNLCAKFQIISSFCLSRIIIIIVKKNSNWTENSTHIWFSMYF
jgi:hypothetical protein